MIDIVEEQCSEEEMARIEAIHWEELKDSLRDVMNQLDDARLDSIRETNDRLTPEYDKLESMLEGILDYVNGRIEELQPGSYKQELKFRYYANGEEVEVLDYALQEGINAVALWKIRPTIQRLDAIDYIRERGLASQNYEATSRAVMEYEAQRGVIAWQ